MSILSDDIKRLERSIKYIVVHCSESPDGRNDRASDIHRWHLENGWSGIGYHAVICRDGIIENGRPHYWQGAHARGYNDCSVSVCLIGTSQYEKEQWQALSEFVTYWSRMYRFADIVGHRDLDSNKTCPNFDVRTWWRGLKAPA